MYEDIITKGSLTDATDDNNNTCLFGKLEWHMNYEGEMGIIKHSHVSVVFNKLPCIEAMKAFKSLKEIGSINFEFREKYIINYPGLRVWVSDDTSFSHFRKAIRHLFALAVAEMTEFGVKVIVNIDDDRD